MKLHRYAAMLSLVAIPTCHKKAPDPVAVAAVEANDAIKEQALKDLQSDLLTLRTQLNVVTAIAMAATPPTPNAKPGTFDAALYTCDRVALASRALADDARAQSLIGEADAMCSYQAPLAAGERKLAGLEAKGSDISRTDCGSIRDVLARVGPKYKSDDKLADLARRFKVDCPHVKLSSGRSDHVASAGGQSRAPDPAANRADCKRRCDDAAWHCRSSCNYCGTCTSDKTWEWCNATCNNCKSSCEQNEKFCQASCGG